MRDQAARRALASRVPRAFGPALVIGAALLALAGCGGSSSSGSSSAASTAAPTTTASTQASTPTSTAPAGASSGALKLAADPEGQLRYDTTSLTTKAGKVSIEFTNAAPLEHNVTVESSSGSKVGATPTFQGGSKTLSLDLKAGTYKFYCSVPGHRQAGMQGTITVQ